MADEAVAEGPVPGQRLPVEEDHEVRQVALVVAVAADLAHEVHAHRVAAEREEDAVAERQDAGVAPDQVHRQRRDGVAHDLADERQGVVGQVQRVAFGHHQVEQRRDDGDGDRARRRRRTSRRGRGWSGGAGLPWRWQRVRRREGMRCSSHGARVRSGSVGRGALQCATRPMRRQAARQVAVGADGRRRGVRPCGAYGAAYVMPGGRCGGGLPVAPAGRAALRASCRDVRCRRRAFLSPLRGVRRCAPRAGMCARRRSSFLCFAKERNQRKATRMRRPSLTRGVPCGARSAGRSQKLAPAGLKHLRPTALRAATPRRCAPRRRIRESRTPTPSRLAARRLDEYRRQMTEGWCHQRGDAQRAEWSCIPRRRRRGAQRDGVAARSAVERRCLSPRRGRVSALAPAREHRSGPLATARGAEVGSPFFACFLWRSKESRCAAGRISRHEARSGRTPRRGEHRRSTDDGKPAHRQGDIPTRGAQHRTPRRGDSTRRHPPTPAPTPRQPRRRPKAPDGRPTVITPPRSVPSSRTAPAAASG